MMDGQIIQLIQVTGPMTLIEQCSKSRNLIPLNPGWFIGIPVLDYEIIPSIIFVGRNDR